MRTFDLAPTYTLTALNGGQRTRPVKHGDPCPSCFEALPLADAECGCQ